MSNVVTTAFVMAAGLGTRMRPLTDDRPKALIEVEGKALIDHMIDRLAAEGIGRFVVNVHYFADRLEAHLKARRDVEIIISDERERLLETGGGLKKARPLLGDDPIIIVNTDSVWIEDDEVQPHAVRDLIAAWKPDEQAACLMLAEMSRSTGFDGAGDFFLDPDGRLRFRNEAASAPYAYMGVHITHPQIVDDETAEVFSLSQIWRREAQKGRLAGSVMRGDWMHVGDPAARDVAEIRLAQKP